MSRLATSLFKMYKRTAERSENKTQPVHVRPFFSVLVLETFVRIQYPIYYLGCRLFGGCSKICLKSLRNRFALSKLNKTDDTDVFFFVFDRNVFLVACTVRAIIGENHKRVYGPRNRILSLTRFTVCA